MKILQKLLILSVLFFGVPCFATPDYVSVFQPVKTSKSSAQLRNNLQKDILKVRSLINPKKKVVFMKKTKTNKDTKRVPASI